MSVGPLKSGHIGTLEARLKLIDAGVAGNYSTFWILTIRGFRFCSLSAEVVVKPIADESYVVADAPQLVDISEQENVPVKIFFGGLFKCSKNCDIYLYFRTFPMKIVSLRRRL